MNLRMSLLATLALASVAYAQPTLPAAGAGANPTTQDSPYQVSYISNISSGQSYVNITNDGARGGATQAAGTAATIPGSICANVFVVAADEEFVSCCSCPVTPDGLVSLSNTDLTTNPIGRVGFNSITVKLVATVPTAGTAGCTGSAPLVGTAGTVLANGMIAWATHLHANTSTSPTSYALTETTFTPATIDGGFAELVKLGALCNNAVLQGTGTGICNSCELQGLGAASSSN